ncbi:GntR family transcriptional regulator [Virgibacillus sp. CBA3643]|uniref:GntR family transcriptional regulator n=1 Tax=Virgibacillus sp. CBA3643 TaxID=2942278 RepID=UPI0035A286DE
MNSPLYEVIYEKIKEDIITGKYQSGERIPSEKEIAETWGVSRITPKRSLEKLVTEGLIVRQAGKGSFVSEKVNKNFPSNNLFKKERPNVIGLIVPNIDDNYGMDILSSIEGEAANNNTFIIIKRSLGDFTKEKTVISELMEIGVSGLIILPTHAEHFNEEILKLVISDFPIVLVDRYLKGVPATSVSSDNHKAAKKATEYLFELGHQNICLLSSHHVDTSTLEERREGFIEAHVENDINIDKSRLMNHISSTWTNSFKDKNIQKDVQKIINHLNKNPQLTALFAVEYRIALLAEFAVKRMDLRVPEDISIICFDSSRESVERKKFTYIQQRQQQMGELAVKNVLKMQKGEKQERHTIKLDTDIVKGNSTKRFIKNG